MLFTPTTAALVLAFTSSAIAAPGSFHQRRQNNQQPAVPVPAPESLSITQQLLIAPSAASRFDILKDDADFKFNLTPDEIPANRGGILKAANRNTFPALVGTGAAMALGKIAPCGINTFHVHPRSAELQIVIEGSLVTEMVPENAVRPIRNVVNKFEMVPFYQGAIHHQFNPNCEEAVFIASFANEDPGTGQVVNSIFKLDQNALLDTFGQSFPGDRIEDIKNNLPESVVAGVRSCNARCQPQNQPEEPEVEEPEVEEPEIEEPEVEEPEVEEPEIEEPEVEEPEIEEPEIEEPEIEEPEIEEPEIEEPEIEEPEIEEPEVEEPEVEEPEVEEPEAQTEDPEQQKPGYN
ncbi:unnamed protein product [Parascedosporium putredinis]|uniref:Cupin type-1 domain-containing protein n=1 Tax=Parascedosporium putredinis TaxID=1442378 RepID=A0A9P1GUA5_9PEZI|nr:unnamed protein product [Parascedosporium putredinis]CAI7987769.1 unnamed protein product [Parascedosporium putredinis]